MPCVKISRNPPSFFDCSLRRSLILVNSLRIRFHLEAFTWASAFLTCISYSSRLRKSVPNSLVLRKLIASFISCSTFFSTSLLSKSTDEIKKGNLFLEFRELKDQRISSLVRRSFLQRDVVFNTNIKSKHPSVSVQILIENFCEILF